MPYQLYIMSRYLLVPDKLDTTRFMLVPEDLDMSKTREVRLPPNLYVPGKKDTERSIEALTGDNSSSSTRKEFKGKEISNNLVYALENLTLAKKLAFFLNIHGFNVDVDG